MCIPTHTSTRTRATYLQQAVALLVQELCTGPAADVTTVIRTALERGYRAEFQVRQKKHTQVALAFFSVISSQDGRGWVFI